MERERASVEVEWKGEKRRRFVKCDHLVKRKNKTFCNTCWGLQWRKTPKGKTNNRTCKARDYYKRLQQFGSSAVANRIEVPGNAAETERRREYHREAVRRGVKKYHERWGRPERNFTDRFHRELGHDLGLKSKAEVQEYIRLNGGL